MVPRALVTCQFPSYQSFSGTLCVSLASTWTQLAMHSTTHFFLSARWVAFHGQQRQGGAHAERACTELLVTPSPWILTCHSLAVRPLLKSTSSVSLSFLPCSDMEIIGIPHITRSLWGINGSEPMKVIYELGRPRKVQPCYDVFIFSQLLMCHICVASAVPLCPGTLCTELFIQ